MATVIGLTGNIGAGKSTIVTEFARQGAAVFDCDKVVPSLYENELLEVMRETFPEVIEDGQVSKALIKSLIMPNASRMAELEAIVHPAVRKKAAEFLAKNQNKLVVMEIQLLFESGALQQPEYAIDYTVTVIAPYKERLARVLSRPGATKEDFEQKNEKQMSQDNKERLADFVINNYNGAEQASQVTQAIRAAKFHAAWRKLAKKMNFDEQRSEKFLAKLYGAYSHPSRHYHGVAHINYLLETFEMFESKIQDKEVFLLAIFLHDYIYEATRNPQGLTNEQKSADESDFELEKLGVPDEVSARVKQFILATQKHQDTGDAQINLFLDMDLSILASTPALYNLYAENIRNEYSASCAPVDYAKGRAKFLGEMLARDSIFLTPEFLPYNFSAKSNLARELKQYTRQPMVGVYAGSFDPITRGHMGIICESILKLDKLVIGIGKNKDKKGWMPNSQREELIKAAIEDFKAEVKNNPNATSNEKEAVRRLGNGLCQVVVESYEGMTIDFAIKHEAQQLMRGLRPIGDFESEQSLADANRGLANARQVAISTTFLPTPDPRYIFASSSTIRTLGAEPKAIQQYLYPSTAKASGRKGGGR